MQKLNNAAFYLLAPLLTLLLWCNTGCKKFVQVNPPLTAITSSAAFSNNVSAASVVTSIYSNMMSGGTGYLAQGYNGISLQSGLSADELVNYNAADPQLSGIYINNLTNADKYYWPEIYQEIYVCNTAIEGLTPATGVSGSLKTQLIGEAKFMRAFLNFYALNIFGNIPLITSTNYQINNSIHQSTGDEVYAQIIQDLKDAQSDLSIDFVDATGTGTTERTRPNRGAATSLLSRTYLYMGDWSDAEMQADSVITNSLYGLDTLNGVFLENSSEAIWQLQPVLPGFNTFDGYNFILTSTPGSYQFPVSLSSYLTGAFEPGDQRNVTGNWINVYTDITGTYYYPFKYKSGAYGAPLTEYLMVLRLAEQYLIRSEARAQQGKVLGSDGALVDLNAIRNRAGLPNYAGAIDQASVLNAIFHERQVELFTEWGNRWFDLRRSGNINTVMQTVTPVKGGVWNPDWALYPIPLSEILINPNLTQNPGYPN